MKKAKLIEVTSLSDYYSECNHTILNGVTDWEDISEDDYKFLSKHLSGRYIEGKQYKLIVQDECPIQERIVSLRALIDKENKQREAQEKKFAKEQKERKAKAKQKKEEKERKKFEELKKKFGQ